uniref:Lymphatic vessel endothelial hyaluronic receptor 1b n=2 Tax=Mastacembelus armatus TaxID=205130 RepID=A0A3Q3NKY9_9TELE
MERFCFFTLFLLLTLAACLPASDSSLAKAATQSPRAAGVFMLLDGGKYTLNFTAATAACLSLSVTIATRAQMEQALQRGLETCKFGWIGERVAVVPRLTSDKKCGQGRTGLVPWNASPGKQFGAFCFNASDSEETSTAQPQSSTSSPALTQTSTPTLLKSTSGAPPPKKPETTKTPEQTSSTSAFPPPANATHSARISSPSPSVKPSSTHLATSPSHLITSKPTVTSLTFSTVAHASSFSVSFESESELPRTVSSAKPPLGAKPTALIVLGILLLLLTAAAAVCFHKP